jgi:hypothetical protein
MSVRPLPPFLAEERCDQERHREGQETAAREGEDQADDADQRAQPAERAAEAAALRGQRQRRREDHRDDQHRGEQVRVADGPGEAFWFADFGRQGGARQHAVAGREDRPDHEGAHHRPHRADAAKCREGDRDQRDSEQVAGDAAGHGRAVPGPEEAEARPDEERGEEPGEPGELRPQLVVAGLRAGGRLREPGKQQGEPRQFRQADPGADRSQPEEAHGGDDGEPHRQAGQGQQQEREADRHGDGEDRVEARDQPHQRGGAAEQRRCGPAIGLEAKGQGPAQPARTPGSEPEGRPRPAAIPDFPW